MKESYNMDRITNSLSADLSSYYDSKCVESKCEVDANQRLKFIECNRDHLAFCVKLWFAYGEDLGLSMLSDALARGAKGIFDLIKSCSDFATELQNLDDHVALNAIVAGYAPNSDPIDAYNKMYAYVRFWNRIALDEAPWLRKEAIQKLVKSMRTNRLWTGPCDGDAIRPETAEYKTQFFCNFVLPILRDEMCYVFGGYKPNAMEWDEFNTSNGATQDSCTNPFCKWLRITLAPDPLPIRELSRKDKMPNECYTLSEVDVSRTISAASGKYEVNEYNSRTFTKVYSVAPIVVPKTFKAGRVVCPEKTYYLSYQLLYSRQLIEFWRKRGYLSDEEGNGFMTTHRQETTRNMVATPGYCSIDLSSASDTNSRRLLKDIYPDYSVLDQLLSVMPTHIQLDSTVIPMLMFGTMGSPLTFPMLTGCTSAKVATGLTWAIHLLGFIPPKGDVRSFNELLKLKESGIDPKAIVDESGDYCAIDVSDWNTNAFTRKLIRRTVYTLMWVCGDDVVCPNWGYDHVITVFEMCGDLPNPDKSFGYGKIFREACGYEGFSGSNANVLYLTRGVIYSSKRLGAATWDAFSGSYRSALGSLRNLLNTFNDLGYTNSIIVISDFLSESGYDVLYDPFNTEGTFHKPGEFRVISYDMGSDKFPVKDVAISSPSSMWIKVSCLQYIKDNPNISQTAALAWSDGFKKGEFGYFDKRAYLPDVPVTKRVVPILKRGEAALVSRLSVSWKDAKPKASCICNDLPQYLIDILKERFRLDYFLRFGPTYNNEWDKAVRVSTITDPAATFHKKAFVDLIVK